MPKKSSFRRVRVSKIIPVVIFYKVEFPSQMDKKALTILQNDGTTSYECSFGNSFTRQT